MNKTIFFSTLILVAGILHYTWETLHLPLYTDYSELSALPITLYATLGDVGYTLVAVCMVSLFRGGFSWLARIRPSEILMLAVLGFAIALFVEYKALLLHRWAYTEAMPIVPLVGVGLTPLLQMTLLLPLSVWIASRIARGTVHS